MNLVQQAEQLKSLPEQELVRLQQAPSTIPPYLVVAEMQRRASMRKAFQGAQAMAKPTQPPVAQQLAQPAQQPVQQQQAPTPQPPMQMAGGGLANLAGYFAQMQGGGDGGNELGIVDMTPYFAGMAGPAEVDQSMLGMDMPGYSSMNDAGFNAQRALKLNPKAPLNWVAHKKMMEDQAGESPLKAIADKYGADEEKYRNKKMGLGEILMNLGLTMAASRRPDFLGALGEGGVGALSGWRQDKDRNVALAQRAAAGRERAMEGVQRHKDRIQDYSIDAARSDQARYNQERQYDMSIEAQIQRQVRDENNQAAMMDRQERAQQALEERMIKKDELDSARRMAELGFSRDTSIMLEDKRANREHHSTADPDARSFRAIAAFNAMADDFMKNAEHLEKQAEQIMVYGNKPDNPDAIRKAKILAMAAEERGKAMAARQQHQALLEKFTGVSMPRSQQSSDGGNNAPDIKLPPPPNTGGVAPSPKIPPQSQAQPPRAPEDQGQIGSRLGSYNPSQYGIFQSFVDSWNRSGAPR